MVMAGGPVGDLTKPCLVWPDLQSLWRYLLTVDVPDRSVLGSLSDPGIFQGPGDTVAFLPAMALPPVFPLDPRQGRASTDTLSGSLGPDFSWAGLSVLPPLLGVPPFTLECVSPSPVALRECGRCLFSLWGALLSPPLLSLDFPREAL